MKGLRLSNPENLLAKECLQTVNLRVLEIFPQEKPRSVLLCGLLLNSVEMRHFSPFPSFFAVPRPKVFAAQCSVKPLLHYLINEGAAVISGSFTDACTAKLVEMIGLCGQVCSVTG